MSINFADVEIITIPEGTVTQIECNGTVLWKYSRLPNAYQEVEYIESSGKQYIDTGICPNNNTYMHLRLYTACTGSFYVSGSRASGGNIYFGQTGTLSASKISATVNGISATASTSGGSYWKRLSSGQTYEVTLQTNGDGTYFYEIIDETNKQTYSITKEYDELGDISVPILLFALRNDNIISGTNRLYEYTLIQNGSKVRDFLPCYRKSDNEVGLYDLVSQTFFTNDGSGSFTPGPNI